MSAGYLPSAPPSGPLESLAADLLPKLVAKPLVGVVLGSGLGAFGDRLEQRIPYDNLPGMPAPSVPGHPGNLRIGRIEGTGVACMQGRVHLYEGHPIETVVFGVRLLAWLGCKAVILTNAAGGIVSTLAAGDRMLITDHLNLTGHNPLVGWGDVPERPRFLDMGEAYDRRLGELARAAAREVGVDLKEGVYAGLVGPTYETPAEVRMLRTLGADAVGMSTVLEVIALCHLGVRVVAISSITNLAAGISPTPLSHEEVQECARRTAGPFVALLSRLAALIGTELSP